MCQLRGTFKLMQRFFRSVTLCITLISLFGCQTLHKRNSLYQQFGGQAKIEHVIDAFILRIGANSQIIHYFSDSNISHFRAGFINHMCALLEGPCEYNGDSMVQIHTGMNINERDFNLVVELFINAMTDAHIPYQIQNKVLAKLAPLRSEIIEI